ncbi:YdcF family protein [candidate division KSB1 bacterium]|nr:YdcF family protein [candidate division KSB1 bacterium]
MKFRYFFYSILIQLFVLLGMGTIFVFTADDLLIADQEPCRADVIVVLGGDGANMYRMKYAVQLFDEGYAPKVLFSGGTLLSAGIKCSTAQMTLEAALEYGLPREACLLIGQSQSTLDEAENIRQLCRSNNWRSILLVTGGFSSRRALNTFRKRIPDLQIYSCPVLWPEHEFKKWYRSESGLIAVVNETIKTMFYGIKYGICPF